MSMSLLVSTTGWVNRAGIVIAGTNLFNLAVPMLDFSIASTFSMLLQGYKAVFHTAFDVIFFWVPIAFKWSVPELYKDLFVIWMLCVGTTYRAEQSYFETIKNYSNCRIHNPWLRYFRLFFAWWSYLPTNFSGDFIVAEQDGKKEKMLGVQSEEHFFELTEQGLTGYNPYEPITLTFGLKDKSWFARYFVIQVAATLLFVLFIAATNHGLNMVGA